MRTLIKIIITLVLVALIIWNRLLRQRASITLDILLEKSNSISLAIITILILINVLLFVTSLKRIFFKETQGYLINKFLQISVIRNFINYIANAPKELYDEYSAKYDLFTKQIELSASYIVTYFNYQTFLLITFF